MLIRNYLLLISIICLFILMVYSTYAMFSANIEIETLTMNTNMNYTFKINSNQEFSIGADSKLRFNVIVENDLAISTNYAIYYKIISTNKDNITVAEVSDTTTNTTSGEIQANNSIIVPLVIINNSDENLIIQIGVKTQNIEYENEEKLITSIVDSTTIGSNTCEPAESKDCTEECFTVAQNGYNNTYCTVVCANLTNSSEIPPLDDSGANIPKLSSSMIPVMYYNGNWVKADTYNKESTYKWYDYDNKQWANAVLVSSNSRAKYMSSRSGEIILDEDILVHYVWIPRYKYKVWNIEKEIGTDSYDAYNNGIDIVFEENIASTGEIQCTDYSFGIVTNYTRSETCNGSNGEYYTHPAFTFGDKELEGIWIGKFEISSSNPNGDYGGGNTTSLSVRTKANVNPWNNNPVSNFYLVARNMQNSGNEYGLSTDSNVVDTHIIKNLEWGAVAYFTHSKYGRCNNGVCSEVGINNYQEGTLINATYRTGCGAEPGSRESSTCNEYNTELGMLASTTANVYGIYDMSGGNYEYVMANKSDGNNGYKYYQRSAGSNYTYNEETAKYIDTYANGVAYYLQSAYNRSRLGDAQGEVVTKTGGTGGWYDDFSYFTYSSYPWIGRGARQTNAESAGIFAYNNYNGSAAVAYSSRVVLAVY